MSPIKNKILAYISDNPNSSVAAILDCFMISKQAMHKHLRELLDGGLLVKIGTAPKVYYYVPKKLEEINSYGLDGEVLKEFVIITAIGDKLSGVEAFIFWCKARAFDIQKYYEIYKSLVAKYSKYSNSLGLIDASDKIKDTFGTDCYVDKCFYNSFSAIEIFGRTGEYAQMLYAKQSGSKINMHKFFPKISDSVRKILKIYKIQAVAFVPPTIPRHTQLMVELEKYLKIKLPKVVIAKVSKEYVVAQKTLSKTSERRENAEATFVVESVPSVDTVLLIDDFVGSGSSFNYIAKKIKKIHNCNIITFAISGTPNGIINKDTSKFEVMNEA
jgi:hypothetical protein